MLAGELTGRPKGLGNTCPSFMLKLKQSNLIGDSVLSVRASKFH